VSVDENIRILKDRIQQAAAKSSRNPNDITLMAVTKMVSAELINNAIDCGIKCIGENWVQEAREKFHLIKPVEKHMIGHLQTNKVRYALDLFDCIQSVDRKNLVDEIVKRTQANSKSIRTFIEVNTSAEEQKHGCMPESVYELVKYVGDYPSIIVEGLMTVGPLTEDKTKVRDSFKKLKEIFESVKLMNIPNVKMCHLSMGMSGDFEEAIEEGSTIIRVGTAIFGSRAYNK